MSSILKALRKLEQQNQGGEQPNILHQSLRPVDAGRSWPWRVVCGALLAGTLAGGVLAALILNPGGEPPAAAISPAPVLVSGPEPTSPQTSAPIVAASDPIPFASDKRPVSSLTVEQVNATLPAEMLSTPTVQEVRMESFDIPPAGFQRDEPRGDGLLPYLVSEIVYLADGGSMAVVNDLPVMEGTMVDGALLKQILADRIVLELDGRQVEVGLTTTQN